MCGICGVINFNNEPVSDSSIQKMMIEMKHRGPDDEGILVDNNIGLGHVRLSIIDLSSAGHQPMFSDDERLVVVYNGEIYNYIELRQELSSNYSFKTKTDTEVLIKAYQHWGEDCLDHFNGMFAFAIYDRIERTLFIARDRFGIKPFYYYLSNNQFIFASEIPAILSIQKDKPAPDDQSIFDYLVYNRTDQTERTFFNNIKKLQHAHFMIVQDNKVIIKKWYHLQDNLDMPFKNSEEFKETLSSAIKLRLRSDVPVGVCLSGGLDSSSIVSLLLKDLKKNDLKTFSAIYKKGIREDESRFINEYKSQIKNMFFTFPTADTLLRDMNSLIRAHNEPIPTTGPYAQFKVMELAKDHVVVTLDGQGADEELAGYDYFFGLFFKDLLFSFHLLKLAKEMFHYLSNHRSLYGIKTFAYFLLPTELKIKARIKEKGYIQKDLIQNYAKGGVIAEHLYFSPSLHQALVDHFEYKLEHLLKWEDRNSMWFSLESRVPFLDHRLVEKTLSLPREKIIHKGMTKYILRDSLRGILPENIRTRKDKIGFDTPEYDWFRSEKNKNFIFNLIDSREFQERKYINPAKARLLYERHLSEEINISKEIWKIINLELWFQMFIDRKIS